MPEPSARSLALGLALLAAVAGPASPAGAQVGLGAERYEVTITPPKRPGTEAPVDAESGAAPAAGPVAATPPTDPNNVLGAEPAPTAATTPRPATAPAAPATNPAPARAAANAPLRTLQVGAFRQQASANELRDVLSANFQDVQVVEVQSGGEPLYRVNVGRLPRGPALDDLKKRLVAAGHPAFEVPAPAASAQH